MFDISFMELLVISMVALIVIGPERLPAVARTVGHLYGRCRNFVYRIKIDLHNEMRMEELKKMQTAVEETAQSIEDSVQQGAKQLRTDFDDIRTQTKQSADMTSLHAAAQQSASTPTTEDTLTMPPQGTEKK